jgi:hypothetical protein
MDAAGVNGADGRRGPANELAVRDAVDVALGAGVAATTRAATAVRPFVTAAIGALRLSARISGNRPHTGLAGRLADRGGTLREALERAAAEVVRWILPRAVETAFAVVDVTDLVRAHVDLDALAKILDVDAVVSRVDLDAAVAIIDRADLDRAVSRVDLGAIVMRVDPDEIVARVDIEAALDRLDLAGIARQVIEAIDLAEILRESAGAVSSQADRSVRTEGMNADESVARFFDRVLRRPHPGGAVTP